MKKIFFVTIFSCLFSILRAQEKISFTSKIGKTEFTISVKEIYTEFSSKDLSKVETFAKKKFEKINPTSGIIESDNLTGKFAERKQQLKNQLQGITKVEPVLIYTDGVKQIATGEINLKVKNGYNISEVIKGYNFEIKSSALTTNFFILSNKDVSTEELFNIVNKLQRDKRVEFAEPNFIRELKPFTDDPFFNSQWAIKNQGYLGGTVGADMKVESAWNIATGSGIKVAIIDEGVDLTHPDLQANLLAGFDATGNNSSGAPSDNDAHGTACAGIVGAVANNNIGIAGVAYNAKILPVRIGRTVAGSPIWTTDTWAANGINWAWQNGADVLSNSWGGGSYSNTIVTAINNAVNSGRNSKGCVVLFSAGNDNGTVSFPASLDNVIAVGASSPCDQRKSFTSCDGESWGGNYGTGLDVMAPGVKIYTTDIYGNAGYNSGDYRADFNGTSSACPNAAAVVALILSVNSNLTGQQARNILESSCDKVGGYNYQSNISGQPNGTWSNDAGYGRVNAQAAVCQAFSSGGVVITSSNGDNAVCSSASYTINAPAGSNIIWSVNATAIASINPTTGNTITLTKIADGRVTLTANISGGCAVVTKKIGVGIPDLAQRFPRQSPRIAPIQYGYYNSATQYQIFTDPMPGSYQTWTVSTDDPYFSWGFSQDNKLGFFFSNSGYQAVFYGTETNACGTSYGYIYCKSVASGGSGGGTPLSSEPEDQFAFSPNPTTGIAQVESINKTSFKQINIFDKIGNLKYQLNYPQNTNSATIDVSRLNPDIYTIQVIFDNSIASKQFIKQ